MSTDDEAQAIAGQVLARAAVYRMRTDQTDWDKVGAFAARSQRATAALARAVGDQPLRATPPLLPGPEPPPSGSPPVEDE